MSPIGGKIKLKTLLASIMESRKTEPKVQRDCPGMIWVTIWKRTLYTKLTNKQITLNFKTVQGVLPTGNRLRNYIWGSAHTALRWRQ